MAEEIFTCSVCSKTFTTQSELSEHMVTDHSTKVVISEEGDAKE